MNLTPCPKIFILGAWESLGHLRSSQDKTFGRGRRHLLNKFWRVSTIMLDSSSSSSEFVTEAPEADISAWCGVEGCLQFSNCSDMFRYVQINMVFYGFYDVFMMFNLNQFELTDALRPPAVPHVPPPKTCSLDGGGDSILQSCPILILLVRFVHCLS